MAKVCASSEFFERGLCLVHTGRKNRGLGHCLWSLVCKMLCLSEKNTIDRRWITTTSVNQALRYHTLLSISIIYFNEERTKFRGLMKVVYRTCDVWNKFWTSVKEQREMLDKNLKNPVRKIRIYLNEAYKWHNVKLL